jgi:hypothetical protein
MKTKIIGIGMVALLLVLSMSVSAAKTIQEGVMAGDTFTVVNDRAFDASESVYVRGIGKFGDDVTVYITKNRGWACGIDMKNVAVVKKVSGPISNKQALELGKFSPAIYDIFIDENKNGIVDCCVAGPGENDDCVTEIVDGKSFRSFAFEVLPELATSLLLGAGLLSMVGYFAVVKR